MCCECVVAFLTLFSRISELQLTVRKPNPRQYTADIPLIMLIDIEPLWKDSIANSLAQAGLLKAEDIDPLNLTAMACPAFPLCPLAITEAERGIPGILKRVRAVLDKHGINGDESMVVRVTGCPNGCARPYMAELGFVGDGPNSYQIWLGGTPNQTVLARCFMNKVKIQELEKVLEPLFYNWKLSRLPSESFGSFCNRMGTLLKGAPCL